VRAVDHVRERDRDRDRRGEGVGGRSDRSTEGVAVSEAPVARADRAQRRKVEVGDSSSTPSGEPSDLSP